VVVKDMDTSEQQTIPESALVETLKPLLAANA
jgi:hypothetical protein